MSSLTVQGITKSFNGKPVLTEVNLTCNTGELVGIYGRNGTGKSTLFKILFGTLQADTEVVSLNKEPINLSKVIPKKQIAYLNQDDFLPRDLKVKNLISTYFRSVELQNKIFYDHRIAKIQDRKVSQLSLGERRYLEVLLVANSEHEFIILDEPFSLIEPLFKEVIKELLMDIKRDKGIILTDHYYKDVFQIADKNILLKDGKSVKISDYQDLAVHGYISANQAQLI
jgi:ABC-type multidrug transport system ATPase subunit